jgi:hypothetical protein
MAFVTAWQKLQQELEKLQRKVQESLAERPADKVNQFLEQLKKKQ